MDKNHINTHVILSENRNKPNINTTKSRWKKNTEIQKVAGKITQKSKKSLEKMHINK